MKSHAEIDNPFALAWSMYEKGDTPHKDAGDDCNDMTEPPSSIRPDAAKVEAPTDGVTSDLDAARDMFDTDADVPSLPNDPAPQASEQQQIVDELPNQGGEEALDNLSPDAT